jgi:hypothetical protein
MRPLPTVEAHHEGINAQVAWNVSTDYEFLPEVDPILAPQPSPLARLVDAVRALRNSALQSMTFDELPET